MSDKSTAELEPFLEIDKNLLDEEWLKQPKLYMQYAEKLAKYERQLDEAKSELDVTKAEIQLKVRNNPGNYDLEKVTEGAIEAVIVTQEEYQEGLETLNKIKYQVAIYKAAVRAIDQRKDALENLVRLHGQSYFATPIARGEDGNAGIDEVRKNKAANTGVKTRK